jgi:hypothetical protein
MDATPRRPQALMAYDTRTGRIPLNAATYRRYASRIVAVSYT